MFKKFKWYMKRLSVMSYRELFYRLHEHYEKNLFNIQFKLKLGICSTGKFSHENFNFTRSSSKCLPLLIWGDISTVDQADILNGKHACFSWEWQWKDSNDIWNISLENNNQWPKKYYSKISYRQGNNTGDLRLVWEPSRLQQLVNLSLLADTRDDVFASHVSNKIIHQFEHWVRNNPFLIGVHYISSMECSLRLLSVIITFDNIREHNIISGETWNTLLNFVWSNANYVSKRISLYSSAGNHTIAECSGLLYVAVLFPELKEASKWKSVAEKILFSEFERQVNSDGGGIEQAFCYQAFILDLFGLVIKLYENHDLLMPKKLLDLHAESCRFLNAYASSHEQLPSIGDSDNGYALSKYLNIIWNEKHINEGLTTQIQSGYSVYNNKKIQQQIVFDHGSLGMPPSYGHGHADALSVILKVAEEDILIDPGTYTYTGDPKWREYFRSTRAHNTVTVNGLDQSKQESSFIWSKPFSSKLFENESSDNIIRLLAYHDGYKELGIRHWRGLVIFADGNIIVWDFIDGKNSVDLELNWHLGLQVEKNKSMYRMHTATGEVNLHIKGGEVEMHQGDIDPILGWCSEKYGVKKPISTLSAKCHTALPAMFTTKILLGDGSISDEQITKEISVLKGWIK